MARGQSASSLAAFQKEQAAYKHPPVAAPQTRQEARTNPAWQSYGQRGNWHSSDDYWAARNRAIGGMSGPQRAYWEHPSTIYVVRPSYGGVSGAFLGAGLGLAIVAGAGMQYEIDEHHARWAYYHRNDDYYIQWHRDMEQQALTNEDVRNRLAAYDRKVADLGTQNLPPDPNYLPPGVDPSMVVAADTALMATAAEEPSSPLGGVGTIIGSVIGVGLLCWLIKAMFFRRRSATA